jgi:hypothetical protein
MEGIMPLVLSATTATSEDASFSAAGTIDQITDPGNAGAIPVTASGSVALVTTGAETRTVALPTFAGQTLALYFQTDGGDCVITFSAGFNLAGNTVVTFANADECLLCTAVINTTAGGLAWRAVRPSADATPAFA